MSKQYTFELVITEGCDEFWESLEGKSGCDEVIQLVLDALRSHGICQDEFDELKLIKYENS